MSTVRKLKPVAGETPTASVEKEDLAAALELPASAAERRSTIPVLQCVLLEAALAELAPDPEGSMGRAVLIPADRRHGFVLTCGECGRCQEFAARFMGERVLQLGRARREGWGWCQGRTVEHRLDDGRVLQRVARLCPTCAVLERHAREGGLWGHLLAELHAARAGMAAVLREPAPALRETAPPVHVRPSGQLDLFGHAA